MTDSTGFVYTYVPYVPTGSEHETRGYTYTIGSPSGSNFNIQHHRINISHCGSIAADPTGKRRAQHFVAGRDGARVFQDDAGNGNIPAGGARVGGPQGQHEQLRSMMPPSRRPLPSFILPSLHPTPPRPTLRFPPFDVVYHFRNVLFAYFYCTLFRIYTLVFSVVVPLYV